MLTWLDSLAWVCGIQNEELACADPGVALSLCHNPLHSGDSAMALGPAQFLRVVGQVDGKHGAPCWLGVSSKRRS